MRPSSFISKSLLFILGGPGAGKTTQCRMLTKAMEDCIHFSAGDLLRDEAKQPSSPHAKMLEQMLKEGQIVPDDITINLLQKAITQTSKSIILIDGFPRRIDQAIEFEAKVAKAKGAILVDTTETEMETRLLLRSATSGRSDDNPESIKKRFQTYIKVSVPAIDYMQSSGRLKSVDGMGSKDVVSQRFRQAAWDMLHP
eukprot:TRINITY_DN8863_c0_g1_i1.p1 TRINITY_DN8863_c0_g1~~TRINITY_DN8863_c0_g1_i1.p1  ORF type:complete len:198 (-),score=49.26 TRINITY_DN8863_c0_g1_i1:332-925(-)